MARMSNDRSAKQVMNYRFRGKEGKGRPRKNSSWSIRKDVRGLGLTWKDAFDTAEDRDGWRKCDRCAVLYGKG